MTIFLNAKNFDEYLTSSKYQIKSSDLTMQNDESWQDKQMRLTWLLDDQLTFTYGDKVFVSSEIRHLKTLHIDIYLDILCDKFIEEINAFLLKNDSHYSVLSSVSILTEDLRDIQVGQFITDIENIVVEENIRDIWLHKITNTILGGHNT